MDAAFNIARSKLGDYWQLRVRNLRSGVEDTVDHLYTEAEVESKRNSLIAQGYLDLSRPTLLRVACSLLS